MMTKKVYLSGKMTGLTQKQIKKNFGKAEKLFFKRGFSVMNPAVTYNMKSLKGFSYDDWMQIDFAMIDACDVIALLPGWETSKGAKEEIAYASDNNKEVWFPFEKTWEIDEVKRLKVCKEFAVKKLPKKLAEMVIEQIRATDILAICN